MKNNLLVSFSGGETSAYMAWWLYTHKRDDYNMVFVFANTGQENEETLKFVENFSKHFSIKIYWVEAVVHYNKRKGCTHKTVDYESASRNGEPFEDVIKKYGIPNQAYPHCTRETKLNPITSFTKEYFNNESYYTAIGIRIDEFDRINSKAKENRLLYPLISSEFKPMTKPKINAWWSLQPFRLNLKGYQGNCKVCWKKTDRKLYLIAKENVEYFNFTLNMETKYPRVGAEFSKYEVCSDRKFFRKGRSTIQLLNESNDFDGSVVDDSDVYDYEDESCEVWSSCSDNK